MNGIDWFRVALPGTSLVVTFMRLGDTAGWLAFPANQYAGNFASTVDATDEGVLALLKDLADDCANSIVDTMHPGIGSEDRLAKINEYSASLRKGVEERFVNE